MSAAIEINLLDWRADARERRRRVFLAALAGAALASIVLAGVLPSMAYSGHLERQNTRNAYLQSQINTADQQIKEIRSLRDLRSQLVQRMAVIQNLQRSRASIVHYFDQLAASVPAGVYLTGLRQNNATTTLDGVAESNARVSQYMVNLDASAWFSNPRLVVIKREKEGSRRYANFTLRVDSVDPNTAPAAAPADAAAGQAKQVAR